jgi:hypothetical protein
MAKKARVQVVCCGLAILLSFRSYLFSAAQATKRIQARTVVSSLACARAAVGSLDEVATPRNVVR